MKGIKVMSDNKENNSDIKYYQYKTDVCKIKYRAIVLIFLMFFIFLSFTFWLMTKSGEKETVKIISDTISNIFRNNACKASFLINILFVLFSFIDIGNLFKNRD